MAAVPAWVSAFWATPKRTMIQRRRFPQDRKALTEPSDRVIMGSRRKLPDELSKLIDGYRSSRIEIGESGAEVYRLTARGRPSLILKHVRDNAALSLLDEAARLRWLSDRVRTPRVLAEIADGVQEWLLMTTVPGSNAEAARVSATVKVGAIADALRQLHATDASACPFDERVDVKIARAADNIRQGRVEEEHFDEKNLGRSASDLFSEMKPTALAMKTSS